MGSKTSTFEIMSRPGILGLVIRPALDPFILSSRRMRPVKSCFVGGKRQRGTQMHHKIVAGFSRNPRESDVGLCGVCEAHVDGAG